MGQALVRVLTTAEVTLLFAALLELADVQHHSFGGRAVETGETASSAAGAPRRAIVAGSLRVREKDAASARGLLNLLARAERVVIEVHPSGNRQVAA